MPTDTTTFVLAFLAVFGGIAWYLVRLERAAKELERRVRTLETANGKNPRPPGSM